MSTVNDQVLVYGLTAAGVPVPLKVGADGALSVEGGGGGGGGSTIDREVVVSSYRVKTAFTGASVGDLITQTQVIDVTGTPTTVGVLWRNQTTGLDLGAAPVMANLDATSASGLTDAQLRAASVPVKIIGSNGLEAGVNALGQLRVRPESTSLFGDEFDAFDTVNRWNLRSSGGSVNAATGTLVVSAGAGANAWGGIQSQPTFQAIGLSLLEFGTACLFPNIAIPNTKRFFGMGTIPTTPTLTTPITDGFGFELDGNGALWAVLYESGVRSPRSVNITAAAGLANNTPIPFIMGRRADTLIFYVTNNHLPDATIPLPGLDVTALPVAFLAINGSPAPASAPSFVSFGIGLGDTGGNAFSLKDPTNPFWQAAVTKPSTPVRADQSALAVSLHPTSSFPGKLTTKFREAFEEYVPNSGGRWMETKGNGDIVMLDGNTGAASYLVVSKSPYDAGTRTDIETAISFALPIDIAFGASMSQRTIGQEFSVEVVSTDQVLDEVADLAIASVSQTTTVLSVTTTLPHGYTVGRCIGIRDCSNAAANYPALVVATTPAPNQFTCTVATGTIGVVNNSGFVYNRERFGRAQDAVSQIFETATATQSNLYVRSDSGDALPSGTLAGSHALTVGTTASVQLAGAAAAYAYSFAPTTEFRLSIQADRVQWHDVPVDSLAQTNGRLARTQVCPAPSKTYKFRLRAVNNKSVTTVGAKVVSVTKSGTTTGTFVTATPHGLVTGDLVNYFGSSSSAAAAFPNLATATAVTVVDATTFTAVIGTGTSGVAYGGFISRPNGGNLVSALGAQAATVTNVALSTLVDGTRQLVLTGSTNWALVIGDLVEGVSLRNAADGALLNVDGTWKVANQATTALTLVALPGQTWPADFTSAAGGAVVRRTDFRLSFVRIFDYERQRVEHIPRPAADAAAAMPVVLQGGSTAVSGSLTAVTTVTTVTTVSAVTAANLNIPGTIADVASAALTTTTTVAAITPTFGTAYEVNIPVTVVTGTNPTLDVVIEESDDSGTNWFPVYAFPRIVAVGMYRSPKLPLTGNRVRYVQTVGGGSPSFTRAVNRLQSSDDVSPVRQAIDRAISLTTLNAATTGLNVQNCRNVQLVLNIGTATTPPALQLEGSDDNGASWYAIGSPLTGVASSTVQTTVAGVHLGLVRARVSTIGATVVSGYVLIKGF